MPERDTRSETLRLGAPVAVGAVTLLPVERVIVYAKKGAAGVWVSAAKEPYALVVHDAGGVRAVGTGAEPISLERLREQLPGLDALLASM